LVVELEGDAVGEAGFGGGVSFGGDKTKACPQVEQSIERPIHFSSPLNDCPHSGHENFTTSLVEPKIP
jgi:hypothetical protein